jgi:hypothetical protein
MGYQAIETGYKPEFGLGALYQGFNAANADELSQQEIVKQFLANQHAQVQNPLDEQTTAQNLLANMYKTSEDYQTGMRDTISGQGMSNLAAGQTARNLQQFKETAQRAELESQAGKERLFANMYGGLNTQYDQSKTPEQRTAGSEGAYALADTLSRVDPKIMAQERMLGLKLDSAEGINDAKLENARALASLKAKAVTGDKTAQQAIVGYWKQQLASGQINEEQYIAEISNLQSAISAAKVQPGVIVNPNVAPDVLQPKPPQEKYVPGAASGTNKPALPSGWTMKQ